AGCIGIERRIESIAPPGGIRSRGRSGRRSGRRRRRAGGILRASLRAPAVLILLHASDQTLQLLIAELELLDHTSELPDLAFKPLEAHHNIRAACLGCVLDGLNAAIAAHALAPAADEIKQAARPLAFLRACRAIRASNDNGRQGEHGCASKPEAIHRLNNIPGVAPRHTIPASKL